MSWTAEFETKDEADRIREKYGEFVCPVDDDARLKTVAFVDDAPRGLRDGSPVNTTQVELSAWEASTTRTAAHDSEYHDLASKISDQANLTEGEVSTIELTPIEVDHAVDSLVTLMMSTTPSMVSIMGDNDETLRHINGALDAFDQAGAEGVPPPSERVLPGDDPNEGRESVHDRACRHAKGHCEHGDAGACEFLREECGLDEDEVADLLQEPSAGDDDSAEMGGPAKGALKRSWQGYKGAISSLDTLLEDVREEWEQAQQAAKAINGVRGGHGQDALHFEELEERQARLADLMRKAAADCVECHADHGTYDHPVDAGAREELSEFLDGADETPVGVGDSNE